MVTGETVVRVDETGPTNKGDDAPDTSRRSRPPSIHGWLFLPALGLILGPPFSFGVMFVISQQHTPQIHGVTRYAGQMIVQVAVALFFFQKRRFVPTMMIVLYILGIFYGVYTHETAKAFIGDPNKLVEARRHAADANRAFEAIQNPIIKFVTPHIVPFTTMLIPGVGPATEAASKVDMGESDFHFIVSLLVSGSWAMYFYLSKRVKATFVR